MFGNQNMKEMMSKLQDMQGAVEDSKKRLENIYVKGDALNGKIRFVLDGNRKLKELFIEDEVFESLEKDSFIESMIEGFNNAIKDADHVNENELKSTAFNVFPGIGK
ncbi:YbaB/EbfC family nucleoid-associated protein [Flavobacteriales bacterium]|nr:YbaB/EbfC family nucleoid-associated protein [Flavobacteriales bacterium]